MATLAMVVPLGRSHLPLSRYYSRLLTFGRLFAQGTVVRALGVRQLNTVGQRQSLRVISPCSA